MKLRVRLEFDVVVPDAKSYNDAVKKLHKGVTVHTNADVQVPGKMRLHALGDVSLCYCNVCGPKGAVHKA